MRLDLSAWGAVPIAPLPGGARSRLWLAERDGQRLVARATEAGEPALRWLDRAQALAERVGLIVPRMIPAASGALVCCGWTVEPFLAGQPATSADLPSLRPAIMRWHRATRSMPPRPDHPSASAMPMPRGVAMRVARALPNGPMSAVHGDLHAGNVLRLSNGRLTLVDWAEARRDVSALDTLALRDHPSIAAEIAACWQAEPGRARTLMRRLTSGAMAVR